MNDLQIYISNNQEMMNSDQRAIERSASVSNSMKEPIIMLMRKELNEFKK